MFCSGPAASDRLYWQAMLSKGTIKHWSLSCRWGWETVWDLIKLGTSSFPYGGIMYCGQNNRGGSIQVTVSTTPAGKRLLTYGISMPDNSFNAGNVHVWAACESFTDKSVNFGELLNKAGCCSMTCMGLIAGRKLVCYCWFEVPSQKVLRQWFACTRPPLLLLGHRPERRCLQHKYCANWPCMSLHKLSGAVQHISLWLGLVEALIA